MAVLTHLQKIESLLKGNCLFLEIFEFFQYKGYCQRNIIDMIKENDKDLTIFYLLSYLEMQIKKREHKRKRYKKVLRPFYKFLFESNEWFFSRKYEDKLWKFHWDKNGVIENYENHLEYMETTLQEIFYSIKNVEEEENSYVRKDKTD